MQMVFLYSNVRVGMPWTAPYKLSTVHSDGWNQIDYSPISTVPWSHVYGTYIFALEILVVFLYFGLTKDAHDLYREHLRALGLGRIFPKLNDEYFPSEREPATLGSMWSRAKRASPFASSSHASQR